MSDDLNMDDLDFSKSGGAEVAKESAKGGEFAREIEFLSLKGTPEAIASGANKILIRPVTDYRAPRPDEGPSRYNLPWITADEHNFMNTKPRPSWVPEGQNWPGKMSAGCRKDRIFVKRFGGACYCCDTLKAKVSARTWALGIEREEVRDDSGATIGLRDKTREVFDRDEKGDLIVIGEEGGKKKYQKKIVPAWIVMNQGYKNFFGNLEGQGTYFGTILDADWLISRTGDDTGTNYSFIRVAEQTIPPAGFVINGIDLSETYGNQKFDLRLPGLMEAMYPDMPDLRRLVAARVSDDIINRFFVPGWTPPESELKKGASQAQQGQQGGGVMMMTNPTQPTPPAAQTDSAEVPNDAMAALKARIGQS